MSPLIIESTPATDIESLILDGLELNDYPFFMDSINFGLPASLAEWVKGADSNGAILGRPPLRENRVIEARISVQQQATMDAVLGHIATIEDKLLECEQNANGLALVWSPAESTLSALTFRCLLGEITDLPISWESGYFSKAPTFGIKLTCLPFGEGAEYSAGSVTNTDPMQTLELTGVAGDVPALGRLVVTDAATQSRRYVAWGLESRWYPTSAPPSLTIDSTSLVTPGFAGVTATRSGAYSGATNNVISATLRTQVQAICGLGNLTHIGLFRPHLRFYASATTMAVRLTFQALDGPMRSLSYRVPVTTGWNHVDLGLVSIPQAALGAQRWAGRIEAYSTATGGETCEIDVVLLVPAEAFGLARASYAYAAGVLTGLDDFAGRTSGTALGGSAAPLGGNWDTTGASTDFSIFEWPGSNAPMIRRATTLDSGSRFAALGATATNQEVAVSYQGSAEIGGSRHHGVVARYNDANNHLRLSHQSTTSTGDIWVEVVVGGVPTVLAEMGSALTINTWFRLRLIVWDSGGGVATWQNANGADLATARFHHTALATGGALASGKSGIIDRNGSAIASARYYDDYYSATPAPESIVCHAGQSIEFRHDATLREDATGTYAGPPPEYVGSRFLVPNAGGEGRKTRVAVVARRNDVTTMPDDHIADSTTVEVWITPRYLAVPR